MGRHPHQAEPNEGISPASTSGTHLETLESVVAQMADVADAAAAAAIALDGLVSLPGIDAAAYHEIDRASGSAVLGRKLDLERPCADRLATLDISRTPFHNVFLQRQPVFVGDTTLLGDRAEDLEPYEAFAMVPVVASDDVVGGITALRLHVREWSHEDQLVLPAIGRELGAALSRLAALEALHDRRLPLYDLFDAVGEMIIVAAADGRMIWANAEIGRRLGYVRSEWPRMTMLDLYPSGRRLEAAAALADLLEGGGGVLRLPLADRDGVAVPASTRVRWGSWDGRKVIYMSAREDLLTVASPDTLVDGAIDALATIALAGDPVTAEHSRRVARLAGALGSAVGLDPGRLAGLRLAAGLHDVGKMSIPTEVFTRPRKLTEDELVLIRSHPLAGHQIVRRTELPWPLADIILQHHERLDGSGYPNHLAGDQIVPEARILAVADVLEAMTSDRPYRDALSTEAVKEELRRGQGRHYDQVVVDACLRLIQRGGLPV